jgi:hypothetical protein
MFRLRAAHRLLADDIEQHREEDELQTQEFMQQASPEALEASGIEAEEEVDAADTLDAQGEYELAPYMFASRLGTRVRAIKVRAAKSKSEAQQDLPQNQMEHPANQDLDLLVEADSTSDSPFDNFREKSEPSLMYLEDQPDVVRGSLVALAKAKKSKKKKPAKKKHTKKKQSLVDKLLDEDTLMYTNEASIKAASRLLAVDSTSDKLNNSTGGQKFTYNSDNQPGSVHVRFPISDSPTDGSSYMHVRGEVEEAPEVLGEPSEEGEVQILSSDEEEDVGELGDEDSADGEEVLGDADPKVLWNVANQPLS